MTKQTYKPKPKPKLGNSKPKPKTDKSFAIQQAKDKETDRKMREAAKKHKSTRVK